VVCETVRESHFTALLWSPYSMSTSSCCFAVDDIFDIVQSNPTPKKPHHEGLPHSQEGNISCLQNICVGHRRPSVPIKQLSTLTQCLSTSLPQSGHTKCIIPKVQDYFKSRSQPKIWGQLHHFRLLSFPMIKSSTRELVEHMYDTGSDKGNMDWSSRQWKTFQIQRMAQLMTHTIDF
jgi:hypothetical protein